jgi:hypothetical protein
MKVYDFLKEIEELKKRYGNYRVEELEIEIYDSYNDIDYKPTSIYKYDGEIIVSF